ncbi:MAG: glycosyl transferase [Alphaproteobacteria bacterium]|nr:glycosyl transferase [Alphaproteobacteria bacterium]HCP01039.1 glycosyl transferase [Rhodospirillaceae bacterium]
MAGAEVGGAEAFFVRLAVAFANIDMDQRVVIRRDPVRARALRSGGVDPLELPFGGRMDFRTRPALQREIDRYKPDIVLSWMSRASWATPKSERPDGYKLVARLGGYYDLKFYRHCDYLIGNTEDIVAHIAKQGFDRDRVVYLPNFVHPPTRPKASRIGFDTPLDVPLLLGMGRLHENKAFDILLRALVDLSDVWLWIAGEGPEAANLSKLAAELGVADRVRFLGWRDDPDALMQACDIFVCSSRHEPLGNIVLEAWAAEKPVVAAAAAGPASLIGDNAAGVIVPVDDVNSLTEGIRDFIADPASAARLAGEGRRRFEDGYTQASVVTQYQKFFERIS